MQCLSINQRAFEYYNKTEVQKKRLEEEGWREEALQLEVA